MLVVWRVESNAQRSIYMRTSISLPPIPLVLMLNQTESRIKIVETDGAEMTRERNENEQKWLPTIAAHTSAQFVESKTQNSATHNELFEINYQK